MPSIRRGSQLGGLGTKHVGTPGRHWPRAPGRAPRFSLQDGDIPAPVSQAAAAPHTSETDSAGPGSGSRIRRRGPGPEPAAKQPPLRPRPGGAKRKMVRAPGPARGEASRRLRAASVPRAAPGRAGPPAPPGRRGLLYPSVLAAGSSGAPGGQSSRGRGRAQPHPGLEAWHPPPCPPTLTAQLRGTEADASRAAQRTRRWRGDEVGGTAGGGQPIPSSLRPGGGAGPAIGPRSSRPAPVFRAPSGSFGLLRAPPGSSGLLRAPPRSSAGGGCARPAGASFSEAPEP